MSAWTKTKLLGAALLLMSACGASQPDGRGGQASAGWFEDRPAGWMPISANQLTFHHVGSPVEGRKTYVGTPDDSIFQRLYGNFIFSLMDGRVSGLAGDRTAFAPLIAAGRLERISTTGELAAALEERRKFLPSTANYRTGSGEVFLVTDGETFDRFAQFLNSGAAPGLKPLEALGQGCSYSRLAKAGTGNEAAVLLVQVPDRELSLGDLADKQCLDRFFMANMGVRAEMAGELLPPGPDKSRGGCAIARILRPSQPNSDATEIGGCGEAPNRRAPMLLHYLERFAANGDAKAAELAKRIRNNHSIGARERSVLQPNLSRGIRQCRARLTRSLRSSTRRARSM